MIAADLGANRACAAAQDKGDRLVYPQTGIVATVEHERPHNGVAYEAFPAPSGPFAILPMTGNRSSLVWTEAKTKAPGLLAMDETGFHDELARRFGSHLGETRAASPRWSYPLAASIWRGTSCVRALRWPAAAPMAFHPIAGQGLNLGLKADAAALTEVLAGSAAAPGPRYRRAGYLEALRTLAAVFDSFNAGGFDRVRSIRLFSNDIAPLRHIRDLEAWDRRCHWPGAAVLHRGTLGGMLANCRA